MAALPYMQFEVAKYLADTTHLTTVEHGAYFLLICNYWQRGKPIQDCNRRLASVTHLTEPEFEAIRDTLKEYFSVENGYWVHHRIERDLLSTKQKVEKKRAAGKASARAKMNRRSTRVATPVQQREYNIKEKNIYSENSEEFRLSKILFDLISKRDDKAKANLQKWAVHIDRMIRLDNRSALEIERVIQWCQSDDFWQNNILSTAKLRKQYSQLKLKMSCGKDSKLCVVDRGPGVKYQTRNGQKVYLCEECYKAMKGQNWGHLSDTQIERAVEQGKRRKPVVDRMAEVMQ
jgi:uncharacterized protein YdaU (DUF1376 family)